jgi:hypothetical protein
MFIKKTNHIFTLIAVTIILFTNSIAFSQKNQLSIQDYIDKYKEYAIKDMIEFGIPASITIAQGLLESSNGNSKLAIEANNHFGIKCHNDWTGETFFQDDDKENECFRKYNSVEESFKDHSQFLKTKTRYANLFKLDKKDYKGWAKGLKEAGYATNPQYPELLINLIEKYKLMVFDQEDYTNNIKPLVTQTIEPQSLSLDLLQEKIFLGEIKLSNGNTRKIYSNNGVKFIIAKKGDKFFRIVEELEIISVGQLLKYNDLPKDKGNVVREGQIIYIKPKRNRAKVDYHIVKKGETMYDISQIYAIKLKKLYKKNRMEFGTEPTIGEKLFLKKKKPINA